MEDLSEKIQKMNLSSEELISGECLKVELNFLDDVIDSFYTVINGGDIDFDLTKNKIKIILPNSSTCCSMCNCSVFKFTNFLKDVFQRHKELHNLGWGTSFYVHVVDETVTFEFNNNTLKRNDKNGIFSICDCYYCYICFDF